MTATEHFTALGGLRARYLTWGDPARPAVLMLHGLRSYAGTWTPFARELAGSYHVVAPDFRGRGGSAWDPGRSYYLPTYAADLEELVAQLGLPRFALVGHSMGGAVGYAYAAAHPDQVTGLLAEDIGPGSSTGTGGAERALRTPRAIPSDHRRWRGSERLDSTSLPLHGFSRFQQREVDTDARNTSRRTFRRG